MSDRKASEQKLERITKLRQRGANWASIGRDTQVALDRRTVKKMYEAWEREQSAVESRETRLQLKRELMSEHVNELVAFAGALVGALDVPELDDERAGQEAVRGFLRTYVGVRSGQPLPKRERDEKRLLERRNERLYGDLLVHAGSSDVPKLIRQYEVARDSWLDGRVELEERAETIVQHCLRNEGESGGTLANNRGVVRRLAQGMSLAFADAVLRSADPDPVRASFKQFGVRDSDVVRLTARGYLRSGRIYVEFSVGNRTVTIEHADDNMHMVVGRVLDGVATLLVDGPEAVDVEAKLDQALVKMMQCHDDLMTAFDDPGLRRLILDTRCDHCPL
jgi:hypothetical protein